MKFLPSERPSGRGVGRRVVWLRWLWCIGWIAASGVSALADDAATAVGKMSVADFQGIVSERERVLDSFRLEGVVCAVNAARHWVVLQDRTAAALFELPALPETIAAGVPIAIVGKNCTVAQGRAAIQVGTAPTINLDGVHGVVTKAGRIELPAGRVSIRLVWFNGRGPAALKVQYQAEGLTRRPIPDTALWRSATGSTDAGLNFAAYEADQWANLADLYRATRTTTGTAPNFNCAFRTRPENAGLEFQGYLDVPRAGNYTFYLESDDGAQLEVGNPAAWCEALPVNLQKPAPLSLDEPLTSQAWSQWVAGEGTITFAAKDGGDLKLDLGCRGGLLHVTVVDGAPLLGQPLVRQRVRVTGLCEPSPLAAEATLRLLAPSAEQVAIVSEAENRLPSTVLRTTEQVRNLAPDDALHHRSATVAGVVTWASPHSAMLQDATGGVFVLWEWGADLPTIGDLWEVEGRTLRGGFAPSIYGAKVRFLGHAGMPEPIRANWDQLVNGSLDMEYVDIQGVLIAASPSELTLMTRGGNIRILNHPVYPLPSLLTPASEAAAYVGSVLRIRGVVSAESDPQTRHAVVGAIRLGSALVSVEERRPEDPFAVATKKAADLFLFDGRANAFQRAKLAGQIIHARPGAYFLLDGQTGIRLRLADAPALRAGDQVEAVGFPRLGGPSLVLEEAAARVTGRAALQAAMAVAAKDLRDRRLDATLVQVDATLLQTSVLQGEPVLEVQSGPNRFAAHLESTRADWPAPRLGSRLQLTGAYAWNAAGTSGDNINGFELLLDGPGAVKVLQAGPWWTERRILAMAAALLGGLAIAVIWISLLRRQVEERTAQWQKEIGERQLAEHRRSLEQERARVAHDLHDELGAGLTEMGILGALAKNPNVPPEEKEGYLNRLTDSASALVTGLDEIVWAINPQYDSLGSLATYYSFFAERFLNLAGMVCRLEVAEDLPEAPLDSHVRHSIFLAFKEALNNIVRHSGASEVRLVIAVVERELAISIHDNGRGLPEAGVGPGSDGLAGMRDRLRQLGGHCELVSGEGTTVVFRLPLNKIPP